MQDVAKMNREVLLIKSQNTRIRGQPPKLTRAGLKQKNATLSYMAPVELVELVATGGCKGKPYHQVKKWIK